jgi:nicotinamide mononucleotide transporter
MGWYWWTKGSGLRAHGAGLKKEWEKRESGFAVVSSDKEGVAEKELKVTRLKPGTGVILIVIFMILYVIMWKALSNLTDSPVPGWDSFITSLSIIATWMLARKIYEHWWLWIIVNSVASVLFLTRGLYPTAILYIVYGIMSFAGLREWKKTFQSD